MNLTVDGEADFLVTGDSDLLVLGKIEATKIVSWKDFISQEKSITTPQRRLGYIGQFKVNWKFTIFKKLILSRKTTARKSRCLQAESRYEEFKMKNYILIILTLLLADELLADSWVPPKIKDYYNSDSTFYVRIYPQNIPEKYFKWVEASPKKKKKFHPSDTLVTPCYARMFKVLALDDSLIWEQKLINRIAPVTAIVSNDGKFLATFDNWYSMGCGVDVMAYNNEKGELIKRHMLEEISPFPINTYEISISSIWWRCGQEFIDNQRISICFVDENEVAEKRIYNLTKQKVEENAP